jgi:hypothetical protein
LTQTRSGGSGGVFGVFEACIIKQEKIKRKSKAIICFALF